MNTPVTLKPGFKSAINLLAVQRRLLALLMVLLFISGCVSQQVDEEYEKSRSQTAAESNTALGLEYMNLGQYEVALGKLKKAIKANPEFAPAHTVLAVLYDRLGETDLAGKHYQKAYMSDPKDGDVNNNYGVYLCQTGKNNKAIDHFLKALDDPFYSSPAVALTNAGSCELDAGNMVEANQYLRSALKMDPAFPDALMVMAKLNYGEKNYLKSRAFMQRYEAVASHDAASLLLAYQIETALGDGKSASRYKLGLNTSFPESDQAAEIRRSSGK